MHFRLCYSSGCKTAMERLSTKQLSKIGIFIAIAIFCVHPWIPFYSQTSTSKLASAGTAYRGRLWSSERTLSVSNLGETKFARCDVHTVLTEDGNGVIDDWLFLEEVNAVNVVVQTVEGKFVVFNQRKYAIPGETLSPVGGFIDQGESPLTAARREVLEELGLGSKKSLEKVTNAINSDWMSRSNNKQKDENEKNEVSAEEVKKAILKTAIPPDYDPTTSLPDGQVPRAESDSDWIFLGRYRTAANRGGGFLYSYLLKNAVPLVTGGGTLEYSGSGDDEQQQILYLNEVELVEAVSYGRFQEVKWAATFALSLLHLNENMPGCCSGKNAV
mmetsp:Transcript_5949/g.13017  ORF Transcript_5949/g.13017 Transcript_5949/m.13017 type:complete len:330 (-) Transcript_5949:1580-2569(-)